MGARKKLRNEPELIQEAAEGFAGEGGPPALFREVPGGGSRVRCLTAGGVAPR